MTMWNNNVDLLSPEGFRLDGRYADEVRACTCKVSMEEGRSCASASTAGGVKLAGCSTFQLGNTIVRAKVFGAYELAHGVQGASYFVSTSGKRQKIAMNASLVAAGI